MNNFLKYGKLLFLLFLPLTGFGQVSIDDKWSYQFIEESCMVLPMHSEIQTEQNEESVYNILLESSVSSVFADAAWLEIQSDNDGHKLFTYKITERESKDIRDHLKSHNIKGALEQSSDRTRNLSKHLASLKGSRFRSLLAFPITVKGDYWNTCVT